jgi:predicted RNA-binding protein
MRVSKTVREYIEKQVASKFAKSENELQYEQDSHLVAIANDEYHQLMKQASEEITKQLVAKHNITEDMVEEKSPYSYSPFGTWKTKIKELADKDRRARQEEYAKKVNDIIVTLELGGTRADLEKMLAEI